MQYISFAFTAVALIGLANSLPIPMLFEPSTTRQALGLDPIPAKFDSRINPFDPAAVNTAAANSYLGNDFDAAYSVYRSDLQTLAREISGRASTQRTSTDNFARRAFQTCQTSFQTFRQAARPTATTCAALRLNPAADQETAVKYVAFVQHTADNAYQHTIQGARESAYWDFCLIDDYMAAVSSFIDTFGVNNGRPVNNVRPVNNNGRPAGTY